MENKMRKLENVAATRRRVALMRARRYECWGNENWDWFISQQGWHAFAIIQRMHLAAARRDKPANNDGINFH